MHANIDRSSIKGNHTGEPDCDCEVLENATESRNADVEVGKRLPLSWIEVVPAPRTM